MSAKPTQNISPETVALYEQLVATAGLARKGASMPYTALNGNMFSYLDKDGQLALRLPAEAREAFLAQYPTPPVAPYGAVQPEYVYVPADLLADTAALQPYFAQSVAYARSLKPKPTAAKAASHGSQRRALAKRQAATAKKKRLAKR